MRDGPQHNPSLQPPAGAPHTSHSSWLSSCMSLASVISGSEHAGAGRVTAATGEQRGAAERAVLVLRKSPDRWRRAAVGNSEAGYVPHHCGSVLQSSCAHMLMGSAISRQCRSSSSLWVCQRMVPRAPVSSLAAQPLGAGASAGSCHRRSKLA